MPLVSLSHVSKHYGADIVLDDVSFALDRGDHAALVGTNGAGKSTILRIIAGVEEADSGTVSRQRALRIAYLSQEPDFDPDATPHQILLGAFRHAIEAQERLRDIESLLADGEHDDALMEEYGLLQEMLEASGYDFNDQIERVLQGLDIDRSLWHNPVEQLSGGQRTRVNLGLTLLQDADLLLLDEPTNHLDIPAVEWLETYLSELPRAFLLVAHDRYLLDRTTRRTIELSFHHITEYDAPYSRYLRLRAERLERQRHEYEGQQRDIARTEEFVRRYGAGQRAKEARGRQKQLDRLERVERPREEAAVHLQLRKGQRTGDLVLEARDLRVGYPNHALLRLPPEVVLRRGDRVAVIGPNGSGKTTLVRTLVDLLPALAGKKRWGSNVKLGYYSQTLSRLNDANTILQEIQSTSQMNEEEARGFLGRFLFSADDVLKKIGSLSGGERSRVALAQLILEQPNVLVLDEPTNHLDIASREALIQVLDDFQGTIIVVSHDRALIDALAQQLWVVGNGRLVRYAGNYSDFMAGSARPLDRDQPKKRREWREGASVDERVREMENEAEALAGRLGDTGPTTSLAMLAEMTAEYEEVRQMLDEAQAAWTRAVRDQLHAFSA